MTRYELFDQIQELCSLKQTGEHQYNKMVFTGKLNFYDYGTGMLDVCIYYLFQENQHIVRIWFGTIDDGDTGSWTICNTKEEALVKLEQVKEWLKDITTFPTLEKINKQLLPIGIYICYE